MDSCYPGDSVTADDTEHAIRICDAGAASRSDLAETVNGSRQISGVLCVEVRGNLIQDGFIVCFQFKRRV